MTTLKVYNGEPFMWPQAEQLEEKGYRWKNCPCGKPLYVIPNTSDTFKLPADFRGYWPFNKGAGQVVHATREDTEKCQISVVHFRDYPFVNHHYGEIVELPERLQILQEVYSRVKMAALMPHRDETLGREARCQVCREPWYLVYDPKTGRAVTMHSGMAAERKCAILARITRGAKP